MEMSNRGVISKRISIKRLFIKPPVKAGGEPFFTRISAFIPLIKNNQDSEPRLKGRSRPGGYPSKCETKTALIMYKGFIY